MEQDVRTLRSDVDDLQDRCKGLEEGYGMRDRFLFGWIDHEGYHKGIIEVLSDGMTEANRNLTRIDERVSGFFIGLRAGAIRGMKWVAGLVGAGLAAGIWFVAQHPSAVAKAVHDLLN